MFASHSNLNSNCNSKLYFENPLYNFWTIHEIHPAKFFRTVQTLAFIANLKLKFSDISSKFSKMVPSKKVFEAPKIARRPSGKSNYESKGAGGFLLNVNFSVLALRPLNLDFGGFKVKMVA